MFLHALSQIQKNLDIRKRLLRSDFGTHLEIHALRCSKLSMHDHSCARRSKILEVLSVCSVR